MKKIAYITRNLNVNGISSVILNYCKGLNDNEFEITIFAGKPINNSNMEICKRKNVRIIETPKKRGKNPLKYYLFLLKNLKEYDIVHVHGNSRTILIELLISKLNKNKYNIAHCHSVSCDKKFFHYLFTPIFKKYYDVGLACSREAGRWMFGNNEFKVIPNGFETKRFIFNNEMRNQLRKKLNLKDKFVIGHIGNFSNSKNYPFLLELFDRICRVREDAILLMVGNYNNNKELFKIISESNNYNKIILYGTTDEIFNIYNVMDVFVFPSQYEGLGLVLLEAQCNGLKCVTSTGVPNEVEINSKIINFLDLNDKIDIWLDNVLKVNYIDRYKFFSENKEKINYYNIDTCLNELTNIYKKLI